MTAPQLTFTASVVFWIWMYGKVRQWKMEADKTLNHAKRRYHVHCTTHPDDLVTGSLCSRVPVVLLMRDAYQKLALFLSGIRKRVTRYRLPVVPGYYRAVTMAEEERDPSR